jgi:hypothetical protein
MKVMQMKNMFITLINTKMSIGIYIPYSELVLDVSTGFWGVLIFFYGSF